MIGAIIGDIVGSPYEGSAINWVDDKNFPLFARQLSRYTDDTILTCAVADALLEEDVADWSFRFNVANKFREWTAKYPNRGYGSGYQAWADNPELVVNNSYANGSMMRCSPIPLFTVDFEMMMLKAGDSIHYTHNSPESKRGVGSICQAMSMALGGNTKLQIKAMVEEEYGHMCDMSVEDWREQPKSTIRCNVTAPQALVCFLESESYEDAIRNAVYTRGDTDTIAAIAGGIAEAFYGVHTIPTEMIAGMKKRISPEMINTINRFYNHIGQYRSNYKSFKI